MGISGASADRRAFDIARDGNLFPREDILEAVARSDWRDREAPRTAWALAALGIALVCAGTPIADRLVVAPTEAAAASAFAGPAPTALLLPLQALAGALGRAGLGIEAAWFLMSAVMTGLALPALGAALAAFGLGGRVRLVGALAALLAPMSLASGRLPSDFAAGVLGASLLLAAAAAPFDEGQRGARGFGLRLAAFLAVAIALRTDALAAGPALLLRGLATERDERWRATLPVALVFGGGVLLAVLHPGLLLASGELDAGAALALPLVGGALWLSAPLAWVREAEEEPPPIWLAAWLGCAAAWAALAAILGFSSLAPSMAVPALAVLGASVLARRARPDGALRVAAGILGLQLALGLVAPHAAPKARTVFIDSIGELQPGADAIVAPAGTDRDLRAAAFLLRRRHGLDVVAKASDAPGGRRMVALGDPPDSQKRKGAPTATARWRVDLYTGAVTRVEASE